MRVLLKQYPQNLITRDITLTVLYIENEALDREQINPSANSETNPIVTTALTGIEKRIIVFFDVDYYVQNYPDVVEANVDPLEHYLKFGWREKRKPNNWYLDSLVGTNLIRNNPSTPPFILFLSSITDAELESYKVKLATRLSSDVGHKDCWNCLQMKDHFHSDYYRRKYSDTEDVLDALAHYCELGWKEQRDPSPFFSTSYYLLSHQDVVNAKINPFVHYLTNGKNEGRKPQPDDVVKTKLLQTLQTVTVSSSAYSKVVPEIKINSKANLFLKLFQGLQKCPSGLILTVSHDNYLAHTGGIQKFILSESLWANDAKKLYVNICPTLPNIDLIKGGVASAFLVNCTIENEFIGTFTMTEIMDGLDDLGAKESDINADAVIHSVMGWDLQLLTKIMKNRFKKIYFYAHDYFSLCPEYRLLRNGLEPCDAPNLDSGACAICIHKTHRKDHLKIFGNFFDAINPHIVFPSPCAKKVFIDSNFFPKLSTTVIPHIDVKLNKANKPLENLDSNIISNKENSKTIRIAFCGAPVGHKGFFHFEKIFDMCRENNAIEFIHLGSSPSNLLGLNYKEVKLKQGKSTMSEAIRHAEVDLIFLGSTWRETFNFVAYEAVQAGAAIIALKSSGNVVDLIDTHGVGVVVADWQEALQLISGKSFSALVMQWKASASALSFSENKSIFTKDV